MSFDLIIDYLKPIKDLLLDASVSEIMGNPDGRWWCERAGRLEACPEIIFPEAKLLAMLEQIASVLDKCLDADNPIMTAQLPDGSRLAISIPPVVRPCAGVTIRKFRARPFTAHELVAMGTITMEMVVKLAHFTAAGHTMLISGGTGSGKTTLLNVLADQIPGTERVLLLEDTAELRLNLPNLVAMECQQSTLHSGIGFDQLLTFILRCRPDRIILGEVRGNEARTLLDSLNTGHAGSFATIHANSATQALRRFAVLAARGSHAQALLSEVEIEIAEAVRLVVHIARSRDGLRRVEEIIEVTGYDRDRTRFETHQLFTAV